MDLVNKLRMFETLVDMGFKEIEICFPSASQPEALVSVPNGVGNGFRGVVWPVCRRGVCGLRVLGRSIRRSFELKRRVVFGLGKAGITGITGITGIARRS